MKYVHKKYSLDLSNGKGVVDDGSQIVFMGDGYLAIKQFIDLCAHHPAVVKKFKSQLEMREQCKYETKIDKP